MLPALKKAESILVRCPNWVGDIVMATPVYETLRHNFPDATISAHIRPYAAGIIEGAPWFDHVIPCDDKSVDGLKQVVAATRAVKPDVAILLTNTTHSFVTAKMCGVKRIYGYKRNLRRFFLSGGPKPLREGKDIKPQPMQDYYMEICRSLGLDFPPELRCRLYVDAQTQNRGDSYLQACGVSEEDILIGINPGASFGSSKCWPPEYFARLAELLQEHYACKIILLVGPGEEPIADAIMAISKAVIINTANRKLNLADLKPVIKRCQLLITNDTGPRHYATSFQVPSIVLMGPTNPIYTARHLEHTDVIRLDLECSPCHKKSCPLEHHRCMRDISPELVLEHTQTLMQKAGIDETRTLSPTLE